jgi:SAM-dependent methyltransferase
MAVVCPIGFDTERLKSEVRTTYSDVARNPDGDFHFHRGQEYAARQLGYDLNELQQLPALATAPFAGVGNPFKMEPIAPGSSVCDIGSGAGMDCLLAGRRVGKNGSVVGIDMTDPMLERACRAAAQADMSHVRFEKGDIAELPLDDASIDVVISNGVINLAPDKTRVFAELYRVTRPGGRVQFADIVIGTELSEKARNDIELWTG